MNTVWRVAMLFFDVLRVAWRYVTHALACT